MLFNAGSEEFSSTGVPIFGTNALLEDYTKRQNRYRKGSKTKKENICEVDKDMLYYDLAKSPCAVVTFDIKRNILSMSPNANAVFGFDVVSHMNKQEKLEVLSFIHPEDSQKVFNALVNSRINLSLTNTIVRISTSADKSKYRNFSVNFLSVVDEGGTPIRYQCFIHRVSD